MHRSLRITARYQVKNKIKETRIIWNCKSICDLLLVPTAEQKNEKKRELAKRLVEINARKREERLAEDRKQLEKLMNIKKCIERGETKEYQKQMRQNLINNREELEVK